MGKTIDRGVALHQQLAAEGRLSSVPNEPEMSSETQMPSVPNVMVGPLAPGQSTLGAPAPARGSFPEGQISDTDLAQQSSILGAPRRSGVFAMPAAAPDTVTSNSTISTLLRRTLSTAPGPTLPVVAVNPTQPPVRHQPPNPTPPKHPIGPRIGGGGNPVHPERPIRPINPLGGPFPINPHMRFIPLNSTGGPGFPQPIPPRVGSSIVLPVAPTPVYGGPQPVFSRQPLIGIGAQIPTKGKLTADQLGSGINQSPISISHSSGGTAYNFRGVWNQYVRYNRGDEVVYQATMWLSVDSNQGSTPYTNNPDWQSIGSYSAFEGAWSSTVTYAQGAEVTYNGSYWVSTQNGNLNNTPGPSSSYWTAAGTFVQGVTNNRITYDSIIGDTSGDTSTSIVDSANKRFVHTAMSGPVQNTINSSSEFISTAPISGRTEGIGTTVTHLTSAGELDTADSVAKDGTTYLRTPQYSGAQIVLDNPNALLGTVGWTPVTGTLGTTNHAPWNNGQAIVCTAASGGSFEAQTIRSYTAVAGDIIYWSAWFSSDGTFEAAYSLVAFDGAGNQLAVYDSTLTTSTSWTQVTGTQVLPANTASIAFRINRRDSGTGTNVVWATGFHAVRQANLDNEVQDGSTYARQPVTAGAEGMVDNASFSINGTPSLVGWRNWNNSTLTLQTGSGDGGQGTGVQVKITGTTTNPGIATLRQFSVLPGDTFLFNWWSYADNTTNMPALLAVDFYDGSGNFLSQQQGSTNSSASWVYHQDSITVPANAAYMIPTILGNTTTPSGYAFHISYLQIYQVRSLKNQVGGPYSTGLNQQGSIVGNPAASPSYTSTTSSIQWSWGAFDLYFPDGSSIAVASGSQNFTGLTSSTTYYFDFYVNIAAATMTCVMSDQNGGKSPSSVQFLTQTIAADGHATEITDLTAATTSSGTGGGSGGGGSCFSGNVTARTKDGFMRFDEMGDTVTIVNRTGEHLADHIVHRVVDAEVIDIGDGWLVTPEHPMAQGGGWVDAENYYASKPRLRFSGTLHNLHVRSDNPANQHYILGNGDVAHNKKKLCFSGDTKVKTPGGWMRFSDMRDEVMIENSEGTFRASLVRHDECDRERLCKMPSGFVSASHLIRTPESKIWKHSADLFPLSNHSEHTLYNLIVHGSNYYELEGGYEAKS